MIGEEPTPHFYSKIFAKYQVIVEEGMLTPTQKNMQAQQMLEINATFGREVFPPSMIIQRYEYSRKAEAHRILATTRTTSSSCSRTSQTIQHAFEEAKLKELYLKLLTTSPPLGKDMVELKLILVSLKSDCPRLRRTVLLQLKSRWKLLKRWLM